MLTDSETRTCEILGDARSKGTKLLPMSTYMEGFYEITETWASTLGGSTCIIIKDQHDMDELHKQNPVWADSLKVAKAKKIHFSIGACHGGKDIRKAMHMADERMYADKNAYYEAHPEEKYR